MPSIPRFLSTFLLLLALTSPGNAAFTQVIIEWSGSESPRASETTSREGAIALLQRELTVLQAAGYLEARLDTQWSGAVLKARIISGPRHILGSLVWLPDTTSALRWPEPTRRKVTGQLDPGLLKREADPVLDYLENHGYPFAAFELENLMVQDSTWHLTYRLNAGPKVLLDSLAIRSDDRLPARYISRYIGWKKGQYYNEAAIRRMRIRLTEIPFITIRQTPEIRFHPGEADLFLTLSRKPANTFNGIIGIQPAEDGRTTLTGDIEIRLLNTLQRGEEIYFNWRRLQTQTQELHARTRLPYLFNTPFGTEAWIRIYRRDTTFSQFRGQLALVFDLGHGGTWKAFAEQNSTSRLSRETGTGNFADVSAVLYGLGVSFQRLDYRFNPRRGWMADLEVATGRRESRTPVSGTDEIRTERTANYRYTAAAEAFIPLWQRQTLRIAGKGAALFAPGLSDNELFRIGGLRTIRGIDEESIFARAWACGSLEYRFLLDQNSAVYLYADQSWYEADRKDGLLTDDPVGFGAGVFFDTRAGIFSFNYGLARKFDNPMLLRNARLSFGFSSLF